MAKQCHVCVMTDSSLLTHLEPPAAPLAGSELELVHCLFNLQGSAVLLESIRDLELCKLPKMFMAHKARIYFTVSGIWRLYVHSVRCAIRKQLSEKLVYTAFTSKAVVQVVK